MINIKEKPSDLKRARNEAQKLQRCYEIVTAASKLLQKNEYEDVSLNTISREAKLSKPSIYLYFKTREEIFLAVFMDAFSVWMDETTAKLKAKDSLTAHDIAKTMVNTAWKNDKLRMMGPLLVTSIEKNISNKCMKTVIRLKQKKCSALCNVIQRSFPQITEELTFHLMLCTMSLFGQFVSYEKNKCMGRVLNHPEFNHLQNRWDTVVVDTICMLLKQMLESGEKK